ncbi:synaptotagmin-8 isoform X2 [Camelus bactrianus]|uniref:Synaptotagmin-8 isoform X2 n=1 Tax=Camelus bactrianus TaxID=9837 RepID=A0AC58QYY6_CAMBA
MGQHLLLQSLWGPLQVAPGSDVQPVGLRRDPSPKGVPHLLRPSSSGPEVGLPEALPPTPLPPKPTRISQSLEAQERQAPAEGSEHHPPGPRVGAEAGRAPGSAGISWQRVEMGHPPDPYSVPAPVGTSAGPGLIPDLITRIPWSRWALVAATVLAGVLLVSCLLCASCCCRRRGRHRKKPRDKKAVGLGRACGTTTTHLVQPDVDNVESGPGGPQQWGCLQLSLEYDFGSQEIKVGLRQAADLRPGGPRATADPYARVSLSPLSGRSHETKVHRSTLCLVFDETCCFHVSLGSAGWGPGLGGGAGSHPCPQVPPDELPQTALRVQVLDGRSLSQHQPLAELSLPLGAVDLQHVLELWLQLGPPGAAEPEQVGELCFSLRYVPGSGRLTVVVLEARGLSPGLAEPYVKVQLLLKQRKWKKRKTSARKGTAAPYFNEAFTFPVPFSQIQPASPQSVDLVLAVWARGPQFRPEPVGKVVLGARASGQPLQHWADMLAHARRPVVQWHRLQPAREVDRALALQPRWRLPLPGS